MIPRLQQLIKSSTYVFKVCLDVDLSHAGSVVVRPPRKRYRASCPTSLPMSPQNIEALGTDNILKIAPCGLSTGKTNSPAITTPD